MCFVLVNINPRRKTPRGERANEQNQKQVAINKWRFCEASF